MGTNIKVFWGVLAGITLLYFLTLVLKNYLLYRVVLSSNTSLHETMLNSILRSPSSFFDSTPSGVLINKFSNDLGLLDKALAEAFFYNFEAPCSVIITLVNICQIYPLFIPAAVGIMLISVLFFFYARPVITQCKALDLTNQDPIFQTYSETMAGLTQVRIYGRRQGLIREFANTLNNSVRSFFSFSLNARGFAFYETVVGLLMMCVAVFVGISQSTSATASLYGVIIIYLFDFCDNYQWFLRQLINSESMFLSYERIARTINLQPEKELRNKYDEEIGLSLEVQAASQDEELHQEWPQSPSI
jgi:ATP-binding cassette subfamily C (CFTR/MRP) protein 4